MYYGFGAPYYIYDCQNSEHIKQSRHWTSIIASPQMQSTHLFTVISSNRRLIKKLLGNCLPLH